MKTTARFITTLALALAATGAMAADRYWYSKFSGDVAVQGNWYKDEASFDLSTDNLHITKGDYDKGNWTVSTLDFSNAAGTTIPNVRVCNGLAEGARVTFTGGAAFGTLSVGYNGSYTTYPGYLTLVGAYSLTSHLNLGANAQSGYLYLGSGSSINQTGGDIQVGNGSTAAGFGELVVSGGTVTAKNALKIAQNANTVGTARFSDGAVVSVSNAVIGNGNYSDGTLTLSGENTTFTSSGEIKIGVNTQSKGKVTVNGGTITTQKGYQVAVGNSATGTVEVTGGKLVATTDSNAYINLPHDGESGTAVGTLVVSGTGEVEAKLLHVGALANGEGYMTVNGGTVNVTTMLRIGGKYNGGSLDATAKGTYLQTGGTVTAAALELGSGGATGMMTLDGGTLVVPALAKGSGSGTVNFNGGTLKASAATGDFIASGLACDVQSGGLVIDTDYAITIQNALTGVGTITKRGAGTLSFTVNPTCAVKIEEGNVVFSSGTMTGKVTVGAGTIYQYDSALAYSGGIEIEEGGYLAYAATESGTIAAAVTGATEDNVLVVTGTSEKTGTASVSGTTITITVTAAAATETTWIGAAGADWNTAANWTHGIPSASTEVNFIADAVAVASADCAAGKICLNGHSLTFGAASGTTRRLLAIAEFDTEDGGTLVLKTAKITGAGGTGDNDLKPLVIPANIAIRVDAESELNDNWGTISVLGKVTLNANLQLYYYVDLFGGVEGTGNINSCYVAARSRTTDVVIGTRLTGSRYFGGDWSNWSGSFTRTENTDERIVFINDLEATNATFNLYGDVTLGTNTTATGTLTFKFGTLNMTGNSRRIEYSSTSASYAVQVGAGKFDSKKYFNNGNTATKVVDGTLRKVGDGTLTYTGFGFNIIDVQGGEFMFVDGPYTGDGSKFNERYTTIDTLTVAAGATLSGTNYTATAIASLTLEEGAFIAGPGTKLTSVGTASLAGAKVLVEDSSALSAGEKYNLISATTLSGTPELYAVDSDGNHVAASNGKAKNWWLAKARNNVLRLFEGNPNAGLAIIFR